MNFILIFSRSVVYNDRLLQKQNVHTQTLLPKPCNFCHVSFGQQYCWGEVPMAEIRGTEHAVWMPMIVTCSFGGPIYIWKHA